MTYYNIGDLYKNQSKYKEALECFNKSYNIWKDKFGDDHQYTKAALEGIAVLYKIARLQLECKK